MNPDVERLLKIIVQILAREKTPQTQEAHS